MISGFIIFHFAFFCVHIASGIAYLGGIWACCIALALGFRLNAIPPIGICEELEGS
jgi:hypothetical protein